MKTQCIEIFRRVATDAMHLVMGVRGHHNPTHARTDQSKMRNAAARTARGSACI